jgi:hypothetical protein
MKCWFCDAEARGVCIACGRAVCHEHGYILDEFTHAKSDTSTGYASYFKAFNVLKCKDCKIEWESWEQGKKIVK